MSTYATSWGNTQTEQYINDLYYQEKVLLMLTILEEEETLPISQQVASKELNGLIKSNEWKQIDACLSLNDINK